MFQEIVLEKKSYPKPTQVYRCSTLKCSNEL